MVDLMMHKGRSAAGFLSQLLLEPVDIGVGRRIQRQMAEEAVGVGQGPQAVLLMTAAQEGRHMAEGFGRVRPVHPGADAPQALAHLVGQGPVVKEKIRALGAPVQRGGDILDFPL